MWIILSVLGALAQASGWAVKKQLMQNPRLNLHIATVGSVTAGIILTVAALTYQSFAINSWGNFLAGILVAAVLNCLAMFFLLRALDIVDLGYLMAWLTATSLTIVIPPIFILREVPSPSALLGIFLVFLGAFLLEHSKLAKPKDSRTKYFLLIIGLCYTFTPTATKVAIQESSPLLASGILFLVMSLLFSIILLAKGKPLSLFAGNKKLLAGMLLAGFLTTVETIAMNTAFAMTNVSYAMGLKRTAPVFALIMGYYWFGEQFNLKKMTAVACMIAGAVVIGLFP